MPLGRDPNRNGSDMTSVEYHDMDSRPIFYVYMMFRPTGEPCYVGKGKGNRTRRHFTKGVQKNPHLVNIIENSGGELPVVIIQGGMFEVDAFLLERQLIKEIGREIAGGQLVNLTDGGDGFSGGRHSEEARKRISAAHIGNKYNVGRKVPAESIAKRVAKCVGQKRTPEQRARMSEGQRGNKNKLGYKLSDEARANIRKSAIGRTVSPEGRAKLRAAWQRKRETTVAT
jgi:hypothetical protein